MLKAFRSLLEGWKIREEADVAEVLGIKKTLIVVPKYLKQFRYNKTKRKWKWKEPDSRAKEEERKWSYQDKCLTKPKQ